VRGRNAATRAASCMAGVELGLIERRRQHRKRKTAGSILVSKPIDEAMRLAALSDLRRGLEIAGEIGGLEGIEGADPHLEMGALYELSLQRPVPPVLLFRKIKGHPDNHRVVCNVRSSKVLNEGVGLELVQNYRKHRRKQSEPIPSEYASDGPV